MPAETLQHHRPHNADEKTAAVINKALDEQKGETDAGGLINAIQEKTEGLQSDVRSRISKFVTGIRPNLEGVRIRQLESGIGGQWNGETTISTSTLEVRGSIEETLRRTEEVAEHEGYHDENDHKGIGNSAGGDGAFVTIGGVEMTEEAFIEGLTVSQTGNEFVSDEYRSFESDFQKAVGAAGISIEEVETAVKEKDLASIDDRIFEQGTKTEKERPLAV